jgi:hypothetical protein
MTIRGKMGATHPASHEKKCYEEGRSAIHHTYLRDRSKNVFRLLIKPPMSLVTI